MTNRTGIICAMEKESRWLIEQMTDVTRETVCGTEYCFGKLGGKDVVVATSGVGKVLAAACAQTMIIKYSPSEIINTGIACSLSEKLGIYDIVIASGVVQHDFDTSPSGDPVGCAFRDMIVIPSSDRMASEFEACAKKLGNNFVRGIVATGDQFIVGEESKSRIADLFGAVACEMEGGAIGTVCYAAGVDYAVLRSISDNGNGGVEYYTFAHEAARRSCAMIMEYLSRKA